MMKPFRFLFLLGFVLPSIFVSTLAYAQWGGYRGWDMGPGMVGWGMMGWFGPLMMLVFWGAVIVAIVFLIRWIAHSTKASPEPKGGDSAMDILKKRYARGEINKEEFENKKKDLL
jgi:putative membrane protein